MPKRLLDYDPIAGVATYHAYDHAERRTYIETAQDVQPILEANKALQTMHDGGAKGLTEYSRRGIKAGWWHVAEIPNVVIEKWIRDYGINALKKEHWPKVKKLLNDPEWRYLRSGTGRV